uniref:Uncharacterized protein n=1 Tax=Arundo donax TaxID=35708 RepID=A0A0A9CDF1_ARUDO
MREERTVRTDHKAMIKRFLLCRIHSFSIYESRTG